MEFLDCIMLRKVACIFFSLILFSNCNILVKSIGPVPIVVNKDSFLLVWNAEQSGIPDLPSSITGFELYYRGFGSSEWNQLRSIHRYNLRAFISVSDLDGYGSYEIGIRQVYKNGRTSDMHKSTDFNAKPTGGWYLVIEQK